MKRKMHIVALVTLFLLCTQIIATAHDNRPLFQCCEKAKTTSIQNTISDDSSDIITQLSEHTPWYVFDNDRYTITGFYDACLVETFINDFIDTFDVLISQNGVEVTKGVMQEGMNVSFYFNQSLIATYVIVNLWPSVSQPQNMSIEQTESAQAATATNSSGFILPIDNMNLSTDISSGYGSRTWPDGSTEFHKGIDIPKPAGTTIRAVKNGTIDRRQDITSGYGKNIIIGHGSGLQTLYAHMSSFGNFQQGQSATQGSQIGYVGTTGASTGNHLHFEVRVNGNPVDPLPYLQGAGNSGGSSTPAVSDGSYIAYGGHVYRVVGGAPVYVGSWANVGGTHSYTNVSAAVFNTLRQYPKDGTFVRDKTGKVYRFAGGAPIYVTDSNNLEVFGPSIYMVDSVALNTNTNVTPWNHVRKYPADGTYVQTKAGQVFRFVGGAPTYVSSWSNVGSPVVTPTVVDKNTLNSPAACAFGHVLQYPKDGVFVKDKTGKVYRFAGGAPIYVTDSNNLEKFGPNIYMVDSLALSTNSNTAPWNHVRKYPADGTFVQTKSGQIFRFAGGAPIFVSSWESVNSSALTPTVVDKNTINSPAACAFGHILQYPKDGTFVKTKDNHIFRFAGGAPIFVDSWDNVGGEANATLVDKATLNQPDLSAPFNHVRRFSADGTLVRTISGKLFEFTNEIPVYQSTGENTTATLVSETGLLGNHFASAYELTLVSGETTAIDGCLGLASYSKFYKFTAPATGTYTLGTSSCTGTLCGELYDANQTLLTQDSNGGTNGNFLLTYLFTEGETYFIKVQNSSSAASQTGSYTLNITAA